MRGMCRKPKILLVEDEPIIQKLHFLMLQKIGCEVDVASNGQEALTKTDNTYDLILMDVGLPDIAGIEVSKKIRENESLHSRVKETPIIALTAYCIDDIRDACYEAGINQVIAKPIQMIELQKIILIYLGGIICMNIDETGYRLITQYKDGKIILENINTGLKVSTTAFDVLHNPQLIQLLNEKDRAIIRFIANETLPV